MIRVGSYNANPEQAWTGLIGPSDLDHAAVQSVAKRFGVACSYVENLICAYQNASLDNANARAQQEADESR